MKKTAAVCLNVLLLLFRSRTAPGIILLMSALSVFIFLFARSDGELVNELRIRLRYALHFSYGLLSLAVMYLACVSLRKEIDNRQFHNISSAPVHRAQIWLGKYFAVIIFGVLAFAVNSAVLAACAWIYIVRQPAGLPFKYLHENFLRSYYECSPEMTPINDRVDREFKRLQAQNLIPAGTSDVQMKNELQDKFRQEAQLVEPGGSRTWTFKWNPDTASRYSGEVTLRFKFYAEQKRRQVSGSFKIASPDASGEWKTEFTGFPYAFHKLRVPLSKLPSSRTLQLSFQGNDTPYLIFPVNNGVALLYDNGGIFKNYLFLLLFSFLNICVLAALGLCFASMFTYSVSVFVTLTVYLTGMSADFFSSVMRELTYGGHEGEQLPFHFLSGFIRLGIWLTKGIKLPDVVGMFTEGRAIPMFELLASWGPGMAAYTAAVIAAGIYVLTKKEIDKLLTN